ncbi:MAG: radical SAM protein [Candidatus Eremiobacterota bacterium]
MSYDILLVDVHRDYFGSVPEDISIGMNLLTVFLRDRGYNVEIFRGFSAEALRWIDGKMDKEGAKTIGFYSDYENIWLLPGFCRYIKEKWNIPVFIGGPQATGIDREFMEKSGCDAVVMGEGEFALLELLDSYINKSKKVEEIDGLCCRDSNGKILFTPERKPVEDLDSLPWPDFRLEKGHEKWNIIPVMTGRGCPYRCAFCYEGGNTRKVRFRKVGNVLDEIKTHFRRHPNCKYIFFIDDTFTLDPKRVDEFCTGLSELRKEKDFVWFCEGHVQTLYRWPEMMEKMAQAGLVKLFIGIESGSDKVLSLYGKKTTAEMIETVVKKSVKAGIKQITGNIIIGGPVESDETLKKDIDLIMSLMDIAPGSFDSLGFFLMPYPGTSVKLHPETYGIRLIPEREGHALEDIPLTETEHFSWINLFNARNELNRQIIKKMQDFYINGKIPDDIIITNYKLAHKYGVYSRWFINIFRHHPVYHRYYNLLSRDALKRSSDIPSERLLSWHPQRVFELWGIISYDRGYPQIGSYILSPLEYELLLLSSGKLRLKEILDICYRAFSNMFEGEKDFQEEALKLMDKFEKMRWLAYARF